MRKIIIALWATILVVVAYFLITQKIEISLSELPEILKSKIQAFGFWSIVMFVVFGVIRPFLLIPGSAVLLTGAVLFGYMGIIYSLLNEILSAGTAFFLSRYIGHDFIENHTGEKFKNFEHKLENHSFKSVFLLRVMFFVPDDLVSYAAGASNVTFMTFILASTIGAIPRGVLYNYSLNSLGDIRYLIVPAGVLVISLLCEKTIKYAYVKHRQNKLAVVAELGEVSI